MRSLQFVQRLLNFRLCEWFLKHRIHGIQNELLIGLFRESDYDWLLDIRSISHGQHSVPASNCLIYAFRDLIAIVVQSTKNYVVAILATLCLQLRREQNH